MEQVSPVCVSMLQGCEVSLDEADDVCSTVGTYHLVLYSRLVVDKMNLLAFEFFYMTDLLNKRQYAGCPSILLKVIRAQLIEERPFHSTLRFYIPKPFSHW